MKTTFLRNMLMVSALVAGFSFTSCKDKTETETTETETIETTEGTQSPIDTVVTEDDTIIDTGDARKPNDNPVGTQVP